ncbi:FAD-binding oxidoreductase [Aestuariivirga litoralis]|uniref:FAD-binding oxidoreductase n=1 Tax=Aestuariivirga litoralis TaxID=2650924 RepID=UPI0018C7B488|nr:FAD-binding oxidoreductase [Aestuariivirga litoralis]MBG1232561.1 FAD-binding oxidoreductase [Aestuariivirga litoralis]
MGFTRRGILLGAAAGAVATHYIENSSIPSGLAFPEPQTGGPLILNDASELSPTPVAKHIMLEEPSADNMLARLRAELKEARAAKRPLLAHAARHSMGGQSLARDGTAVTMAESVIEPDTTKKTYRVTGGTRWREVITKLDSIGFSPAVMQSNNDFGVASTYSVNAHGWPVPFSSGGTTVQSLKMMLASGEHINCSRNENADIFSAAMGGYGLFGVITELDVAMVPNANLLPTYEVMPSAEFGTRFVSAIHDDKSVNMAYGRLDVTIGSFFEEALLITYRPAPDQSAIAPLVGSGFMSHVAREIFRAQVGSDHWKMARWGFEARLNPWINTGVATRNSLMNEPVITLDDKDPDRTDILHEYFVDASRFVDFVTACRDVIPSSFQQLLNITLRFVDTDHDSVLTYATTPRVAAVLLFSQEKSLRAEADMARMTHELIERVLAIGGSYYLPYRPHASLDQFQRAYARHGEFAALKRKLDPSETFRHNLWDQYISKAAVT